MAILARPLARCLMRGCPWRFTDGGRDRWCPDHDGDHAIRDAAESLGIDLDAIPEHGDRHA